MILVWTAGTAGSTRRRATWRATNRTTTGCGPRSTSRWPRACRRSPTSCSHRYGVRAAHPARCLPRSSHAGSRQEVHLRAHLCAVELRCGARAHAVAAFPVQRARAWCARPPSPHETCARCSGGAALTVLSLAGYVPTGVDDMRLLVSITTPQKVRRAHRDRGVVTPALRRAAVCTAHTHVPIGALCSIRRCAPSAAGATRRCCGARPCPSSRGPTSSTGGSSRAARLTRRPCGRPAAPPPPPPPPRGVARARTRRRCRARGWTWCVSTVRACVRLCTDLGVLLTRARGGIV